MQYTVPAFRRFFLVISAISALTPITHANDVQEALFSYEVEALISEWLNAKLQRNSFYLKIAEKKLQYMDTQPQKDFESLRYWQSKMKSSRQNITRHLKQLKLKNADRLLSHKTSVEEFFQILRKQFAIHPHWAKQKILTSLGNTQVSPLKWDALSILYGKSATRLAILEKFNVSPIGKKDEIKKNNQYSDNTHFLFIDGTSTNDEKQPHTILKILKAAINKEKLTVFSTSAFGKINDQVNELKTHISINGASQIVLISTRYGSAVVYRLFDLYPAFHKLYNVTSWINIDGDLYGKTIDESVFAKYFDPGRRIASIQGSHQYYEIKNNIALSEPQIDIGFVPLPMPKDLRTFNFVHYLSNSNLSQALVFDAPAYTYKPKQLYPGILWILNQPIK